MTEQENQRLVFQFFNEVGIIQQLAVTAFNRRLTDKMHVSHFSVLNHFVRLGDGKTPLALSRAFQVTKGTMTNTLSGLLESGYIRFEPHATDGRSKLVYITEAGRTFQKDAIDRLGPVFRMLEKEMGVEKLIEVLPILREVREILDTNRDA